MAKIEYTETDKQGLDSIGPLWQKLIEYHKARSPQRFSGHYAVMTFDLRKKQLLEKSSKGSMRIDLARDTETGELVGYCVNTISGDRHGEIESIYVESDYRKSGIGENLMKRALKWMDDLSVTRKIVVVGVGNEEVFSFYSRYNFYPRATILEQVETKETDSSSARADSE
jgi:ribosomal protein S18 acetylase RimI-like enzyme